MLDLIAGLGAVPSATGLAIVFLALFVGAVVQGAIGLGLGLVAAPVVTLVDPELMPDFLLVLAFLLPFVTLAGERADIDWYGLRWSLPARAVGTAVGVWLVATLSNRMLSLAVAVMVLFAVAATVRAVVVPVNRGTLAAAGVVSGVAGTATSIGGPPMVLLYQHRPPREVRTTMAVYFLVGALLSLIGLELAGELVWDHVLLALLMVPALVAGSLVATRVRDAVDGRRFRAAVLMLCVASALALLARALAG